MLQQMPLEVTAAPPSCVTLPPLFAVKQVIEDGTVVITVGGPVIHVVVLPFILTFPIATLLPELGGVAVDGA